MRGLGLTLVSACVFACSAPPGVGDAVSEAGLEHGLESQRGGEAEPEIRTPIGPQDSNTRADAVLARARTRVRGGRIPEPLRRELVESARADHRHAARLLQAIAGEPPAAVLARTVGDLDLASPADLFEVEPETTPEPEREIEPAVEPVEPVEPVGPVEPSPELEPLAAEEPPDWTPELRSLPKGSPVWWWFHTGLVADSTQAAGPDPIEEFETMLAELPVLLDERPPVPPNPTPSGDGPRLVILTSLSLEPGPSETLAVLELAGAGSVQVRAQPLTRARLRLWLVDAGAVPGFLAARPTIPGVEVVDVVRLDRRLEIEVELAPGWTLRGTTSLANGARVDFGWSTTTPGGQPPAPE